MYLRLNIPYGSIKQAIKENILKGIDYSLKCECGNKKILKLIETTNLIDNTKSNEPICFYCYKELTN